jgi:hypothetical protein
MANAYHVTIGYRTKRSSVAIGMDVEAFNDNEAEQIAHDHVLKGFPARKWSFTKIGPATGSGFINARTAG